MGARHYQISVTRIVVIIVSLTTSLCSFSQYGNEWINYAQQYYKFKVVDEGIYRITFTDMVNAGIAASTISPDDFQIYARETEQCIRVEDGGVVGVFEVGDYLEFYATGNNGWLDETLYPSTSEHTNPHFSLFNDTINYFLTWSPGPHFRMVEESDVVTGAFTRINYGWKTEQLNFVDDYLLGVKDAEGSSYPKYVWGEGYAKVPGSIGTAHFYPSTTNTWYDPLAPDATVELALSSTNNPSGSPNHGTRVGYNGTVVIDTAYSGYNTFRFNFTIPNASIGATFQDIEHEKYGVTGELQAMHYVRMRYPHTFDLENTNQYKLDLPYNTADPKSPFEFTNLNGSNPLLYVVGDTVKIIPLVFTGTGYDALVPNGAAGQGIPILFLDSSEIKTVTNLVAVNGTGTFTDYSSLVLDSAFIIVSHNSLWSAAQAYAVYRTARYNTVLVDVDELYAQFGGGIDKHPLSIRRFADYTLSVTTTAPSNLFLLGKSVRANNKELNGDDFGSRMDPLSYQENLVPTYGYPSSDILFTSELLGVGQIKPAIPTGRLSAMTEQEVNDYLSKVIEFENLQYMNPYLTLADREWMKHGIHFAGGAGAEASQFQSYLEEYEGYFEGMQYGGEINRFYRGSSTDPAINPSVAQEIKDRITEGVSLMTFLGHSGGGSFDFQLEAVDQWGNSGGKYPVMMALACYSGDIHEPSQEPSFPSTSEEYVMEPNGGNIAYISTVKLGYVSTLYFYAKQFYQEFSNLSYSGTLGQQMQGTVATMPGTGISYENTYFGMTLHGDPALQLNPHNESELVIENPTVYFDPAIVTLSDADFDLNVIVTNTGKASTDTFRVEVVRHFPNGVDSIFYKEVYGISYRDTITFNMPTSHNIAVGTNQFDITVDLSGTNQVTEFVEVTNNQLTKNLIITTDGIQPIWPYEYAIIPDSAITLLASTIDPLAPTRNYHFEIDTNDLFNSSSPGYLSTTITSSGGVLEWDLTAEIVPYILEDSTVYFWRVAADSATPVWYESSFQYIRGRTGWGQAHFFQFKEDKYGSVEYNRPIRQFEFSASGTSTEIYCDVYSQPSAYSFQVATEWGLDGTMMEYGTCASFWPALHVVVIDELTHIPWGTYACPPGEWCPTCTFINPDHQFGNYNDTCECRERTEEYFIFFQTIPDNLDSLVSMLNNPILANKYVLIYTMHYATYDTWPPGLFTALTNMGATTIGSGAAQDSVGFAFYTQMGNPSIAQEVIAPPGADQFIQLVDTLIGLDYAGTINSVVAGPAAQWESLHWEHNALESPTTKDSVQLRLYGIDYLNTETVLIDTTITSNNKDSIINLSSIIDASVYPWAKLEVYLQDDSLFTPAQMDRWQLVYTEVPEAALNMQKGFHFSLVNDTLAEGDSLQFAIAIENVTDLHMDSLLVHYWVEDQDRNETYLTYPRQDSLRAFDVLLDTITVHSTGFAGLNSLWIEANPVPLGSTYDIYDQLEQYHFNNIAQLPFYATKDIINPILDVTFDGIHILDGDIVSAKPEIVITLDDENQFLLLNEDADTANFVVLLTDPLGATTPVYFMNGLGESIMQWIPATGADNKAQIIWDATFTRDGIYELLVKGDDKSGNASGDNGYKISFEIYQKPTITEILNYPNPFSTRTQFVFTLTGIEPPSDISIQIFTVTGSVVREIDEDELGPINIGRNFTSFWWDGTDEFGDPLANGVYFYRVVVEDDGAAVEYNPTAAQNYFHQDKQGAQYGKMYLMR